MATTKLTPLQQAFHVIRDLEAKVHALTAEPIAILGMSCRLPGAVASPEDFWRLLATGQDATSELPADRFDVDAFYDPDPNAAGKMYTRRAGTLPSIDTFDAGFFGISPREAALLDPQQRLLLEVTWEALERAGQPPDRLERTPTGVFVAASPSDYARIHEYAGAPKPIEVYDGTGNATCFTAGRISYVLGLEGPCLAVDTACSSSLLAVHLACQSLRAGECDVAIAAGVSLIICPETFIFLSRAGNISPDGRSRAFSAAADGYGRGEGCGVIVLKRLSRARADGDPILAVLRGSAINHGGASSGLTVPNGLAQQAVIRRACANAGVAPHQLGYVEAHGTATLLGDPIELDALGAVHEGRAQPLWVGSVKSNIGHLEGAAGIVGLIKAVLMLQHRQLPASLHVTEPNPHVDWQRLPLRIPTELTPWDAAAPRLAGVSSFGLSGTNVHAIVEEASEAAPAFAQPAGEPCVLPLSACSPGALRALATEVGARLVAGSLAAPLPAIAYTAAHRRAHHEHRLAIAGTTREAWIAALGAFGRDEAHPQLFTGRADHTASTAAGLVFVCSGQGSQWDGMGRALFASSPVFRDSIQATAAVLARHGAAAILDAFDASGGAPDLTRGEIVQPLVFATQVALAALWRSWGVEPAAVTGHSLGEAAAAHIAGALSLDDAARVVAVRSELLARIRDHGGMVVIELPAAEVAPWLARHPALAIAAINAPRSTVVSGDAGAIEAVLGELAAAGVFARRVKIDVASHSPQVAPLLGELRARLAGIRPTDGPVALVSTVTGDALAGGALDADYWVRNLREPVRFADAIASLGRAGHRRFIEISPHPILAVAIEQTLADGQVVASLRRGRDPLDALGEAIAALYASGAELDWRAIYRSPAPCVLLPTSPWQRERYWSRDPALRGGRGPAISLDTAGAASLAGAQVHSPGDELHFVDHRPLTTHAFLDEHRIFDEVVVPGAFHLAAVLAVARELVGSACCALTGVSFPRALIGDAAIHLTAVPRDGEPTRFRRASLAAGALAGAWTDHATGVIAPLTASTAAWTPGREPGADARVVDPEAFYARNTRRGITLGPSFRWIRALWVSDGEAHADLAPPPGLPAADGGIHPAGLDAVFQTFAAAAPDTDDAYVPFSIDRLEVDDAGGASAQAWRCVARHQAGSGGEFLVGDAVAFAGDRVALRIAGLRLKRVPRDGFASGDAAWHAWLHATRWDRRPLAAGAVRSGRWLVFADPQVGEGLADALRAGGADCVAVYAGERFACLDEVSYALDPARRDQFDALFAALARPPDEIVYLWGLSDPDGEPVARAMHGAAGLLHVAQAIAAAALRDPPRLTIVTRGTQRAGGVDHRIDVGAAVLWGMARSLLHEHPALGFARIDLDPATEPTQAVGALCAELAARDREDEVVLRGGERHVARVAPARAPAASAPSIRRDASYLVTGGLGGLGLRVADWLIDHGATRLVLAGRTGATTAAQRAAVAALAARGARVEVARADAAHHGELAHAVDLARSLGPLRGIVHAAGVLDDGLLEQQRIERLARVLGPKAGALHLDALTAKDELDFFVLFSSAAALIGAPGQSNYAAANALLDAVALDRHARGAPALAVQWGAFAEVGMAAQTAGIGERLAQRGVAGMPPADGLRALGGLLASGAPSLAVIAFDPRQWIESAPYLARSKRFSELVRSAPRSAPRTRDLDALRAASPEDRRARIAERLRQDVALVLRCDATRLDPDAPLAALGFDSLLSLELRNRLERAFALTLPATLLWTYPTLTALAEHLAEQIQHDPAPAAPAAPAALAAPAAPAAPLRAGDDPDALESLSEAEREAMLEQRLASLERRL
jgi:acyl transferase domain-containing protein/acyl carrier protein